MSYHVGDIPAQALVVDPAFDTSDFDTVEAELTDPAGETIALDAALDDDQIIVEWPPPPSILTVGGLYDLRLTVESGGLRQRLPLVSLVVQDDTDGWHTLDSIRDLWPDAPSSDRWCFELLEVAKADVLAFAPALLEGVVVPANFRRAQYMHARDIWNASQNTGDSGELGDEGFAVRPYPLDWMVKQVLRPRTGTPAVG